ncbi:hypothetical protein [Desulfosarcina sp.]|uniref:hypothetical protein n=1 Tax=Desulfosarcina sp. TaxID=2027861 RepID=UPI003569BAD6
MKQLRDHHLTDEELIVAMVDAADLSTIRRSHLDACRRCRQAITAVQAPLDWIGTLAERYTPTPSHPVRIDTHSSRPAKRIRRRAAVAMTMAAMGLMVAIWTTTIGHDPSRFAGGSESGQDTDDMVFMAEVGQLIDDPLPDRYRRLIGIDTTDRGEDFMDLIVPTLTGPAPTSSWHTQKGVGPC